MPRADLLISLVKAATTGDQAMVRKSVEAIAAEERSKHHSVLAEQLEKHIHRNGAVHTVEFHPTRIVAHDVVHEITPQRAMTDLVLNSSIRGAVNELVQEHHRSDLLRSYNLQPRHRVLLTGSPGNGKTSLAEAVANALMVPFVIARYDGLITSYLGETATRLRRLFEFAHNRRCVLFFDEFDTLGKERGDIHETGEIKRVVSSLLLHIDDLPPHVVVICATNHPELLDRAVWRRFQLKLELPPPNRKQIEEYFCLASKRFNLSFGLTPRVLAASLVGSSYSDLDGFTSDVARAYVLALPDGDLHAITANSLQRRKMSPTYKRTQNKR